MGGEREYIASQAYAWGGGGLGLYLYIESTRLPI